MTVSVVNKIRSTHQMQSPSVSSKKYGDYRELDIVVLLYMLILLVADCMCGVVGTSFLVVVGQHEDSWASSTLRHI